MSYSFAEKKRIRKSFGQRLEILPFPNMLDLQTNSYKHFLYGNHGTKQGALAEKFDSSLFAGKQDNFSGLLAAFESIFPIVSRYKHIELHFVDYQFGEPKYDLEECRLRNITYSIPLYVSLSLVIYEKSKSKSKKKSSVAPKPTKVIEKREQKVYFGDLPLMTESGSFIINGTERVIVSQLHRSPGAVFEHDKGKTHSSGKILYSARIIPARGAWLDFAFEPDDRLYMRIDRGRKLPITTLLHALGIDNETMLKHFFSVDVISLRNQNCMMRKMAPRTVGDTAKAELRINNKLVLKQGQRYNADIARKVNEAKPGSVHRPLDYLIGLTLASNIKRAKKYQDQESPYLAYANDKITEELLQQIEKHGIKSLKVLYINSIDHGPYISKTLRAANSGEADDPDQAMIDIYRAVRPGEPPTVNSARLLFDNLFSNSERYDLSSCGRMKLNLAVGRRQIVGQGTLDKKDILDVIQSLISIRNGKHNVDDIDHLGNRRVRSVGEMMQNFFRQGLFRISRVARERMTLAESEGLMPAQVVNPKPVTSLLREFFSSSQLSQFMDQNNPLSEVTHKRRISALGPGGLTRERAGFEVRDVHPTHYGRVCPIETPEGANIGLINSLAIYARTNRYGFLETPYVKVQHGAVVKNKIVYLSSIEEGDYVIAQANANMDEHGRLTDGLVSCRQRNEFIMLPPEQVDYMDVSPRQIVSVAAALIPFLEHDDANRALMGSNMQRQAVPTLRTEKPLVGTGVERLVATDSGTTVVAKRSGVVDRVDASHIIIRADAEGIAGNDAGVDIYQLSKYRRSNQNTCINQTPLVNVGDQVQANDVIADGPSTDIGELALGQNVLTAFMSWHGYNFEDSILISERIVKDDRFTTIHIEELICTARDTKLGAEEITADIPNVSDSLLNKMDQSGIVYVGAEVQPGDILVGKITPKGDVQMSSEEKLIRSIFGDKAANVKDTSLRVPAGMEGAVIGVQVLTRSNEEQDERAKAIKQADFQRYKEILDNQMQIYKDGIHKRLWDIFVNNKAKSGPPPITPGLLISEEILRRLKPPRWKDIKLTNSRAQEKVEDLLAQLQKEKERMEKKIAKRKEKMQQGDSLPPGVIKTVKVYLAVKRRIQPGDKLAGRHGNKGVVSMIVPVEDMPYMEDGTPVDVVLNPLAVPSRMNVGQVFETHLGWAAKKLGQKIAEKLDAQASAAEIRKLLNHIYTRMPGRQESLDNFTDEQLMHIAEQLRGGVPMATPVFEGASEDAIKAMLRLAGLPVSGKARLHDGRSGEQFDQEVTVGYSYIMKLNHLVDDKMHARSTGSYGMVTQQPLGGKAQFGGQRFGEMEVWALEAYGAAHVLQEMLTVKADDIKGRNKAFKNITANDHNIDANAPESFHVLRREVRALGINMELKK